MPSSRIEVNNGKYVDDQMANGVPEGGTTGQVLAKASNDDYDTEWVAGGGSGTVTSVGLSMPSAFSVTNSPVTTSGTLTVAGAGTTSQYIRGDGTLANFPTSSGGGASVSYYLNGGTSQGTFGGNTYYQMSKSAVVGTGVNFTINANGYIAQFITDANDPSQLNIPAGNWNIELFLSASSAGGSPTFYCELYKYDGASFTLISSGSAAPEGITNGTQVDLYTTGLAVPATSLSLTDRLAIRIYITHSGRTITLHTQDNTLCQVITTFTTGLTALNGLTEQIQTFATGTSGTDFGISSASGIHTFNLPTASATNRGALSTTDWSTFNGKQNALSGTGFVKISGTTISYDNSTYLTSAITSLNGLTGATQTFVNDTNVTMVSSGTSHTITWSGTLADSRIASASTWNAKQSALTFSTGLTNSSGTVTSNLSVGVSGGQSVIGGTASGNSLTLSSTSNATKGKILFGTSAYDEVNNRLGIGTSSPSTPIHVNVSLTASGALARLGLVNGTLTAAANNDVLVGLDVSPTFSNGAFTGVGNYPLRLGGHIGIGTASAFGFNYANFNALTSNNGIAANFTPNGTPTGLAYVFQFNKTSGTTNVNALLFVGGGSAAGGNSANKHVISSTADGTATSQPIVIRAASTGTNWGSVNDHLTIFTTGNAVIQNTSASATDAGYRFDVNGTGRFQSTLTTAGNIVAYTSKTGAYTATATDEIIIGDATSAAFTVTLPTASGKTGQRYTVKKSDNSANAVTVGTTSSQTIDGVTTYSLGAQYKYVTVISNGSNWFVIANN